MKTISDAVALCDELIASAKESRSEELRREIEEYVNAQKEALETLRKMLT